MITQVRLATGNAGKAAELARLLGCQVLPVDAWDPPVEDGSSFLANARIKALAGVLRHPGEWIVADDSGIEVDALDGAPGIHSARYGGADLDDPGRVTALLAAVAESEGRGARFRCVLVAIGPDGQEFSADGTLEGSLALAPRGDNGFGYDPILIPHGETRTCGELSADEKNAISHRGAAARSLRHQLGL